MCLFHNADDGVMSEFESILNQIISYEPRLRELATRIADSSKRHVLELIVGRYHGVNGGSWELFHGIDGC